MFEYLKQSTEEVAVRHQDEKILKIHERVKYLKRDRKLEAGYMTMEEYIHQEAERRAKLMAESMVKSMAESMAASRVAQNILALLEDLGTLPDQTKERIAKEQNEDVLSAWLKLAARADSIEEVQSKM